MDNKWKNSKTQSLIKAVLALQTTKEAEAFFRDLLTQSEIMEFANRWQAAQMLNNKVPYTEIEKQTGLSSTTVARVSQWLNKGMGGYQFMLKRLALHNHNSSPIGKGLH